MADGDRFRVIGCGAVHIVDGFGVSYCNLAEGETDRVTSMHNVCVHVLGKGDSFDLKKRRPIPSKD